MPLQVVNNFLNITQPVTISIRSGGGPCAEPPSAGYGQITWNKTVTTSASGAAGETDILTISLQASPGKQEPAPVTYSENGQPRPDVLSGPSCPIPGYRSLDAGTVTALEPGFGPTQASVVPLERGQISGLKVYQATVPAGSIQPGPFTVTASGGADVGAFQTNVQIGGGIQVKTPLAGATVSCFNPVIKWIGGDPDSWVTLKLLTQENGATAEYVQQVHGDGWPNHDRDDGLHSERNQRPG